MREPGSLATTADPWRHGIEWHRTDAPFKVKDHKTVAIVGFEAGTYLLRVDMANAEWDVHDVANDVHWRGRLKSELDSLIMAALLEATEGNKPTISVDAIPNTPAGRLAAAALEPMIRTLRGRR